MASHFSCRALTLVAALFLGIVCITNPQTAFARADVPALPLAQPSLVALSLFSPISSPNKATTNLDEVRELAAHRVQQRELEHRDKHLNYDPALIATIGNQSESGHTTCCSAYACAYGDAILTAQANDHCVYGCGCCTWPGWGGGNSSFRSLGSDTALLHEAYDEIASGRPTVIHVAGPYGEHWICLMGYQGVENPDMLTLDNFIALDPANGQEVTASYRYTPFGDACEHVSERR